MIKVIDENSRRKNSFFDEDKNNLDEFEFNQDFENNDNINSPGWIRYQKRIK